MLAEGRWKKARVRFQLRNRVWLTHWVSSRGERDGLHVMIGDYLWREGERERMREGGKSEREKEGEGEHVGDMKYVGSEMKACG